MFENAGTKALSIVKVYVVFELIATFIIGLVTLFKELHQTSIQCITSTVIQVILRREHFFYHYWYWL